MLLGSGQSISARPNIEGNLHKGLGPGSAWCTQGYSVEAAIKTCIGPLRLPDFGAHFRGTQPSVQQTGSHAGRQGVLRR